MRVTLTRYAELTYDKHSRPCQNTLRAMAKRGDIPGAFQSKAARWYVEMGDTRVQQLDAGISHVLKGDAELQGLFQ